MIGLTVFETIMVAVNLEDKNGYVDFSFIDFFILQGYQVTEGYDVRDENSHVTAFISIEVVKKVSWAD